MEELIEAQHPGEATGHPLLSVVITDVNLTVRQQREDNEWKLCVC